MAQIFHRSTNFIARFSVFSALFLVGLAVIAVLAVARSPYMTRQNFTREQPVQFSHKHHVSDDGIDCRYCHTGVETSAVAGIPPTKTCMNCHSVLYNTAAYLEPIRESYRTDKSSSGSKFIAWLISSISITAFMSTRAWAVPRVTGRSTRCRWSSRPTPC